MVNLLDNGEFLGNLDEWSGSGAINRALGYPRLGCVALGDGQNIAQAQDLAADQLYTLHYFYRLTSGATLTVSYGSVSQAHVGDTSDVWHEGVMLFALDDSGADSVTFAASDATAYVDTVTLRSGPLAMSRADIAARTHRRLDVLATDKSLSTTASSEGPEGDYSDAVDDALRAVGAIGRYSDPDVTLLGADQVASVLDSAREAMLEILRVSYVAQTDVSLGPRRENFSQIAGAIGKMLDGGPQAVEVRRLRHE